MGVKIFGQVCALGENAGVSLDRDMVGGWVYAVYDLVGSCRAKVISPPRQACLAFKIFVEGVEGVLPGLPCLVHLRFSVPLWKVVGK